MDHLHGVPSGKITHEFFSVNGFQNATFAANDFIVRVMLDFTTNLNQMEILARSVLQRVKRVDGCVKSALTWNYFPCVFQPNAPFRDWRSVANSVGCEVVCLDGHLFHI